MSPWRDGKSSTARSRLPTIAVAAFASALLFRTSAQAQEGSGAENEIDEARRLSERAAELYGQGQYDAAEPLLVTALRIREKALGPKDPGVAQSLNSLAMLCEAKGDYARAAALYRRACDAGYAPACSKPSPASQVGGASAHLQADSSHPQAEPPAARVLFPVLDLRVELPGGWRLTQERVDDSPADVVYRVDETRPALKVSFVRPKKGERNCGSFLDRVKNTGPYADGTFAHRIGESSLMSAVRSLLSFLPENWEPRFLKATVDNWHVVWACSDEGETPIGALLAYRPGQGGSSKGIAREFSWAEAKAVLYAVGEASKLAQPIAFNGVLGLEYLRVGENNGVPGRNVYAAALHGSVAGFGSGAPLALEMDLVLGGGLGGGSGFYYDLDLLLGPGWWFNQTVALTAVGGVGIDGITGGTMPFALKTPVRLSLSVNLGSLVRVEARAGVNWLFQTSNRRQSGSKAIGGFADEMVAGGRILIGRRAAANAKDGPEQVVLGFTYLEMLGTRTLLFMVGLGAAEDPRFE